MQESTGLLRGKENVEQHVEAETGRMLSEHGMKVRDAREARRKRILARSCERLAFITAEAHAIPTSPLLSHDLPNKSCNALISLSSLLNQDTPSGKEPTIKKSLLFNGHDQSAEAHNRPANNRENTSQEGAEVAQPLKNKEAMEASKEQQAYEKEDPGTFKGVLNHCIKESLFPRLVSAACIALAFLASRFTQDSRYDVAASFPATLSGHLGGSADALSMMHGVLASVMLVDLVLFVGAFFFCGGGRERLKVMKNREANAEKGTLSIVVHLLLSMCVDCSISASLLYAGFLVLSNVA